MTDLHVVILAAGKGTRMKSARPKVLHDLAGRPLIEHVLRTVDQLGAASTVVVVGHGADHVRAALAGRSDLRLVVQAPPRGTGHALLQAEPVLAGQAGTVLLLYADVPLLEASTLRRLLSAHEHTRAAATVLTAHLNDPHGYGRIVRDEQGQILRIVEQRDASIEEQRIPEVNSGIYAFALGPLFGSLHGLATDNAQGEYYLTDLVNTYRQRKFKVETIAIVGSFVANGASIGPFAHIRPHTEIGEYARVGNFLELKKTTLGARSGASHLAYLGDATIGDDVNVGAGAITCNCDGVNKNKTILEDEVFIGSDTQLIAPVRVGKGAYVAAESSVTEDVPAGALAIARGRQQNKAGLATARRAGRAKGRV